MIKKEVNLRAIRENILYLKKRARGKKFCAVVKCNAYGHGIKKVCPAICDIVPHGQIGSGSIEVNAIPFQSKNLFTAQSGIQADHYEHIGRKPFDCRQQLCNLIISKYFAFLLRFSSFAGEASAWRSRNDIAFDSRIEDRLKEHLH